MIQTAKSLISTLREKNIRLALKGDNIEILSYKEKIPTDLLQEIKLNKEELLEYLNSRETNGVSSIPEIDEAASYALSSSQKRMWILSQYQNLSNVYNISGYYPLDANCNLANFKKAINKVIDRHEILRTIFKEDESGEVRQWIVSRREIGFEVSVITSEEILKTHDDLKAFLSDQAQRPFDLEKGPLLRVLIIKLEDGSYGFHYSMHHIICDGWSMNVLVRDTMSFYQALEFDQMPDLPELRIQFKDFSAWQAAQLESDGFQKSREYWLEKLSEEIPLIDLPTSRLRPRLMTFNGRKITTVLSPDISEKIKNYCQQQQGSLFMGLVAAWKTLLYRYTGQTDIVIGTSSVEREDKELEDQIGFYVNTLAIRNSINPQESFSDFFSAVKRSVISDFSHQKYPFDRLLEDLNFSRDTSRSALFDVFVTMRTTERSDTIITNEEQFGIQDHGKAVSKFDLDLGITEMGDCLALDFTYNVDVYDHEMIIGLLGHFKRLLKELLENPHAPIDSLCFLSKEEQKQLKNAFNDTEVEFQTNLTVIDMFEDQVAKTPQNIAVICNGKEITYKDLDEMSNQVAHTLISEHGVKRQEVVGMQLERNEWAVVAILGIMKAGAAYLPIDPDLPISRKEHMVADANVCLLITQVDYMFDSDFFEGSLFVIDVELDETANHEAVNLSFEEHNLAYIIYTSGSTGLPKGVLVEHHSLLNSTLARAHYYSDLSSFLLVPSFSFDSSIAIIWNTLTTGAALHVVSNETLKDPNRIIGILKDYKVEGMLCVPSFYKFLMNEASFKETSLNCAILAGEYLPENLVRNHYELFDGCQMYNEYGPTENTVWASVAKIDPDFGKVTIGKPIANTQIYILNGGMQLMPLGVVGELYIGGKNLAVGYLNQPELTKSRFVDHPFEKGKRLYKTGDLGKWLPDGTIEFIGREDDQVKIRGFRIELGEIEQQLLAAGYINNAVVLARDTDTGLKELVAYVVADETLKSARLRDDLGGVLPDYMIPSSFIQLDKIPLTKNGKINKKALQQSQADEVSSGVEYMEANSPEEQVLVAVLQDVLKRENISIKDSFFNLGGDSIKSILVISKLKQNGYSLKIDDILRYPVIEELATHMVVNVHRVDQSEVTGSVALTPIQHYFFENKYVENKSHYNQSVLLSSSEEIDTEILTKCINILVSHHDALRMVFKLNDSTWEQFNKDTSEPRFLVQFYDLHEKEEPFVEMAKIGQEIQGSFDLEAGPLFKAIHFRLPDGDRLALIVHHLVVDGVSWRIILEDLATLYDQLKSDFPANLPSKTDSFQRWAKLQNDYVLDQKNWAERAYWEELLQQPVSGVPLRKKTITDLLVVQKEISFQLDRSTTNLLQTKFHNVYGTSINDFLLAGFALAMRKVFKLERCVLEMEGHGREELFDNLDISRTVGWFTSLYPLVLDIENAENHRQALVCVKENLRNVPNKGVGFGMWKYLSHNFKNTIEPTVSFNYLGDFGANAGNAEVSIFNFSSESIGANLDVANEKSPMLYVSGMMLHEQLRMSIKFPEAYYDPKKIEELLLSYREHLEELISEISKDEHSYVTPSDLTFKGLSQVELAEITSEGEIEDIYPLSPLQRGIYYDWLSARSSALYFEQTSYRLTTHLDMDSVQKAFDKLFAKYAALRTTFTTDYAGTALQIVRKRVTDNFELKTGKHFNSREEVDHFVRKERELDKEKGFDLERSALMRLTILDLGEFGYEFIWSHHHILMDGWCVSILINDFYKILNSVQQGIQVDISLPFKYAQYIQWLEAIDPKVSLEHWREYLSGYKGAAEIPFKTGMVTSTPSVNASEGITLDNTTNEQLTQFCAALGITQNTFMQGVWGYLLSKYNNTHDVVFGSVVSGRPGELDGVQEMIGLFVNTIPVRVQYTKETTPKELLLELHREAIAGNTHHYMSLSEVQSQSDLGKDLITHLMIFENYHVQEREQEESVATESVDTLTVEDRVDLIEQTNYNFNVVLYPSQGSLRIEYRYDNHTYDAKAIKTSLEHFTRLVSQFVTSQEVPLNELDYLPENEKLLVLEEFNDTQTNYPKENTVIDLFEAMVKKTPDAMAVIDTSSKWTFKQLNDTANAFANYFTKVAGIKSGKRLIVSLDHSNEMMATLLSLKKLGVICVPVDPRTPKKRLNFYQEDSESSMIINDAILNEMRSHLAEVSPGNPAREVYGDAIDSIIYTSGSTGTPKGVMIKTSSIINRLSWMWEQYPFEEDEVCCAKTSLGFVDHIWEFFGPLLKGVPVVFYTKDEVVDVPGFIEKLNLDKVTRIVTVPSLLKAMMGYSELFGEKLSKIKLWVSSGEALKKRDVETFYDTMRRGDVRLLNIYGSTEVTADATYFDTYDDFNRYKNFKLFDASLKDGIDGLIDEHDGTNQIVSKTFAELLKDPQYASVAFEASKTQNEYLEYLSAEVLPNVMNVASPSFIGHMTGPVPKVIRELNSLVTALNQNQVKIETSMVATLMEKQVIGFFHKLVYGLADEFYEEHLQEHDHVFGLMTNGGTVSNIMAVNYSLNKLLGPKGDFSGIKKEGLVAGLKAYGYERVVLLGSKMCHYSFGKALKLLGLGSNSFEKMFLEDKSPEDLKSEISAQIRQLQKEKALIVGMIGVAGATESGNIDRLDILGEIANEHGIHYHVDAAFGGSFLLDEHMKEKFEGIALADSVSICAHKQLYLPLGLSLCLFKDHNFAVISENNSKYQARKGSFDLGKYTIEGSRNFNALILHGALSIFGTEGFAELIRHNYNTAQRFAQQVEDSSHFSLFYKPDLNIVLYRYIPSHLRGKEIFSDAELLQINDINEQLQRSQLASGNSFVSYTEISREPNRVAHLVLRTVFMNPYTTGEDLHAILDEQFLIASKLEEASGFSGVFQRSDNILIGKPIGNVNVYILDEYLNILPIGVVGEICITGECVSSGYLHEANDGKFTDDPFKEGHKLFRTGDLGMRLRDGNISYVGRKDDQVKIRGHRVELGEIEQSLRAKESIDEAVVLAIELQPGHSELMAYFTSEATENAGELRAYLSKFLPDFMIPGQFIQLDKIPLNVTGKVDKSALPFAKGLVLTNASGYVAPRTVEEQVLVSVLKEVLQKVSIGVNENFYSLGGNSIKSLQIISRLKQKKYELGVKDLLSKPKIEDLALGMKVVDGGLREIVANNKDWHVGDTVGLSMNQMRFFRLPHSLVSMSAKTSSYNKVSFESDFREFISHYPSLSLQFEQTDGVVRQRWVSHLEVPMEFTYRKESEIKQLDSFEEFYEPFDLFNGPLIRVLVVAEDKSPNKAMIIVRAHHSLLDAYSNAEFEKGLRAFFGSEKQNPEPRIPYFNFIKWQEKFLTSEEGRQKREFWKEFLKEAVINSEEKIENLEVDGFVEQKRILTNDSLRGIQAKAVAFNVPVSALIFAEYQRMLRAMNPDAKGVCGIMVNGREQQIEGLQTDNLIGVMDNLLPIPLKMVYSEVEKVGVQEVYANYLEARMHQQIPYLMIRNDIESAFGTDLDAAMLGQFNFQIRPQSEAAVDGSASIQTSELEHHLMPGVHLNCVVHSNALEISLVYRKNQNRSKKDSPDLKAFLDALLYSEKNSEKTMTAD